MEGLQINILANIYNHIKRGVDLGRTLIMEQGSARSGKTYNTVEYLVLECVNNPILERWVVDPVTMKKMIFGNQCVANQLKMSAVTASPPNTRVIIISIAIGRV